MKKICFFSLICFYFSILIPAIASEEGFRAIRVAADLSHKSGAVGTYRALIIGINNYQDPRIPDLSTPLNDARVMADVLEKRYGFVVKTLLDRKATRKAIYNALRNLAAKAKNTDSVLIYYVGHGDLDRQYNGGFKSKSAT